MIIAFFIILLFACFFMFAMGMYYMAKNSAKEIVELKRRINLDNSKKKLFYHWIIAENSLNSIEQSLLDRNLHQVAIYGMGEVGKLLFSELNNTNVKVMFGIDIKKNSYKGLDVFDIEEISNYEGVDAVIITVLGDTESIFDNIREKYNGQILWVQDLIHVSEDML